MKLFKILSVALILAFCFQGLPSCKLFVKAAAKHWTRKQKKKFISKCKEGALGKFGDRANDLCSCVVTQAEEQDVKFEEAMEWNVLKIVKIANECK